MALKDPRFTKFKLGWHREPSSDGSPKWYCEMGGVRVAEAAMTGRPGVDDYPWDWYLTDAGTALWHTGRGHAGGVSDTLRDIKERVANGLRP